MSWSIAVIDNNLKITKKAAKEIFKADKYNEHFYEVDDVAYDNYASFNSDHCEHMDWLSNPEFQEILKKNKAAGTVTFGSLEGDDEGSFWGYEFDGKGGMRRLIGTVEFGYDNSDDDDADETDNKVYVDTHLNDFQ